MKFDFDHKDSEKYSSSGNVELLDKSVFKLRKRAININMKLNSDKIFKYILFSTALLLIIIVAGFCLTSIYYSEPALLRFGLSFITNTEWDPVAGNFGALPFIVGTLLTSFIALIISFPISLTIALFSGEYYKTGIINNIVKTCVELLAGIPSIIYGFWGLFVFVPFFRQVETFLHVPPYGVGIMTSSIILSIMIIPYSASIIREALIMVPGELKEAAYSLGATRYEVIRNVMLPFSSSGILAGVLLSLGRALGETMAVTMVIGNSNLLPHSLFAPGNTMASVIANEFTEATGDIYLASLIGIGLLLFVITSLINIAGVYIIKKITPLGS